MQTHTYTNAVATVIAYYAKQITNAAYDSVAEASDYSIIDNCDKIQYLLAESAQHTTVQSLAVAALNSTADTVVRECMYTQLQAQIN
jgi:hypothetical protein